MSETLISSRYIRGSVNKLSRSCSKSRWMAPTTKHKFWLKADKELYEAILILPVFYENWQQIFFVVLIFFFKY